MSRPPFIDAARVVRNHRNRLNRQRRAIRLIILLAWWRAGAPITTKMILLALWRDIKNERY